MAKRMNAIDRLRHRIRDVDERRLFVTKLIDAGLASLGEKRIPIGGHLFSFQGRKYRLKMTNLRSLVYEGEKPVVSEDPDRGLACRWF